MADENIRSWILIELDNGKNYRYVRDVVYQDITAGDTHYKGENGINYWWTYGDTSGGDTWNAQGDTPGKVYYDYGTLKDSWIGDTYIIFPESGGNTTELKRKNLEMPGDTVSAECYNYTTIVASAVSDMSIINEKKPKEQIIG